MRCPISFDSYTKFLSHFNGTNGQTTYTTEDSGARTVTFVGTAQLDTGQKKFGASSLLLDGNSDYVTIPDSVDWDMANGDFTVDFWVRLTTDQTTGFVSQGSSGNNAWEITYYKVDSTLNLYRADSSIQKGVYHISYTPSLNNWQHIAVVRSGSTCYIFLDGVSQSVTEVSAFASIADLANVLNIGQSIWIAPGYLAGNIDEVRISKGIARWTSNFTPPTSQYRGGSVIGIML